MKPAVEAQVLNLDSDLEEPDLHQILTDVIEEAKRSLNQDIDGAELLRSLLNSAWLQSLLKVYECLQRYLRDPPPPTLGYASGLTFQLLFDISALPGVSDEARELYHLLQQPHLQALLSTHDTVAQKDYDPVLPPMPDDLPDDEEATRIVCLVKNKQPLFCTHHRVVLPTPTASPGGAGSRWDTPRCLAQHGGAFGVRSPSPGRPDARSPSRCSFRRGSCPLLPEPLGPRQAARPCPQPRYQPVSKCPASCGQSPRPCGVCYAADLLWQRSLNRSSPSAGSSALIDEATKDLGDEARGSASVRSQRWAASPSFLTVPCCSDVYLQPGFPHRLGSQSPRVRTAPPSPMRPRRVLEIPPLELAKQESLDELRATVHLAACSMENSTKDIKMLGEKMAAATERMTETVQDNSQALVLLTQVVDRLQTLLAAGGAPIKAASGREGTPEKSPKAGGPRPALTHQARCSFPSLLSFTSSSSSLSSSADAPSTSQGAGSLFVSEVRKKRSDDPPPGRPRTNGLTEEPKEAAKATKGGHRNRRKRRKKKAT